MPPDQSTLTGYTTDEELEEIPLPEELVSDVLGETEQCAEFAQDVLDESEGFREEVREDLGDRIQRVDDGLTYETTAGVDGSYTVIEGSGVSIALNSAVIAGDEFQYSKEVFPAPASQDITTACQGLTTIQEMELVTQASSDMVIYDGSFISALVNLNQLLGRRNEEPNQGLWDQVDPLLDEYFYGENYFLDAMKEHIVIGAPKRSPSTHFLQEHYEEYVERFSDRAFFSMILEEGEYVLDHRYESGTNYGRDSPFVASDDTQAVENFFDREGFLICFYKPEPWTRAYRLEIPESPVTNDQHEQIMRTFGEEIIDPSLLEPYPQWLADAMCKKIVEVSEALKDGVENKIATETDHDPGLVHSILQGYRTEMT